MHSAVLGEELHRGWRALKVTSWECLILLQLQDRHCPLSFYATMPTSCSDCGLRDKWSVATGNFRAQPKVNCPRSVTDGLWSHCNFLDPAKPLWLRQCSAKGTAAVGNQQTGLSSLPPQSRTTHHTFPVILTTLCREDISTRSRVQKWMSNTDFYTTGINKPICHWQKCVVLSPTLSSKYVSGPPYIIMVYSAMPI